MPKAGAKVRMNMDVEKLIFRSDFHKYRKIFRALLARFLLYGHAVLAAEFVGEIDSRYYAILAVSALLFVIETVLILYFRYGCEWKRFCSAFICYLLTMVTVLWILRLQYINNFLSSVKQGGSNSTNATKPNDCAPTNLIMNETATPKSLLTKLRGDGFDIFIDENMASLLEQSMMILLIVCRWLLPRGRIDRNSLSQLLIMYSAISADILDFSDVITRPTVKKNDMLKYVVLGVWSWSLVQFTVVITTAFTFRRSQRHPDPHDNSTTDSDDKSETISILMVFFMQDGPFFLTRCCVIYLGVTNYNILFFTLKNFITLILGFYRLFVLCGCIGREGNDLLRKSEIARSMESLDELEFEERPKHKGKKTMKNGKAGK